MPEQKIDQPNTENSGEQQVPEFKNNRELLLFLYVLIRENKKWWLMPILLVLALLSMFVSLTGNTTLLPAIYALF